MIARITGELESIEVSPIGRAVIAPLGMNDERGSGIGYEVWLPAYVAQRLLTELGPQSPGIGDGPVVTLFTMEYFEGLGQGTSFVPRLIGFSSQRELAFFELFTSVKGLGNKRALKAMATSPGTIARAIVERDTRFLQSLPEIGPKLAELIVHELKNKAEGFVGLGNRVDGAASASERTTPAAAEVEPKVVKRTKKGASADSTGSPGSGAGTSPEPVRVPIKETIDALIALGESPMDAERMVSRAIDRSRADGKTPPAEAGALLTLAYASR